MGHLGGLLFLFLCTPQSWAVVGTEEIAQALIQSTPQGDLNYTGFVATSEVTDVQVVMRVWHDNLQNVEKYGFLNQFQSKHSRGSYSHGSRTVAESTMVALSGLPIEPKSLRPKYGTLHADVKDRPGGSYNRTSYGDVVFVFGRHVLPRTTWSNCDSLGGPRSVCPVSSLSTLKTFSSYGEAQIWGDLDLSDVEMIVIDSNGKSVEPVIVEFARRNGIDVYETNRIVGATTKVLRTPEINLRHDFSSGRIRRKSRVLLTETSVRDEIRRGLTPGLAHWASILAPDALVPHSTIPSVSISPWGATYGAKPEYGKDILAEYRDAQQNTIEGLVHIFTLASGRDALKATIVRYFQREAWIPDVAKDRMESLLTHDSHATEIKAWMEKWAHRSSAITKGDTEYDTAIKSEIARVEAKPESVEKERVVAAIEVIEKEATTSTESSIESVFEEIKKLIKEVRHGESEDLRRLSLGALNKILMQKPTQDVIAKKFVRNERFAQVVYRHSDELDKDFLKIYFRHLKDYDKRESAQDRAMAKCAELLGESA